MKKWKLFIGVGLLFIFGVLVGVMGTALFVKHNHPMFKHTPAERKAFVMKRLSRELELNDAQKQQVVEIVNRLHGQMVQRFQAHFTEVDAIVDGGFGEIKAVLEPNQLNALEKLREKLDRKRNKLKSRLFPSALQTENQGGK